MSETLENLEIMEEDSEALEEESDEIQEFWNLEDMEEQE